MKTSKRLYGAVLLLVFSTASFTTAVLERNCAQAQENAVAVVNINTASPEELITINGIGPALADRIVQYREEVGAFSAVDDILNVRGIGEEKFKKIREHITV